MHLLPTGSSLAFPARRLGIRRSRVLLLLATIGIWLILLFLAGNTLNYVYKKVIVREEKVVPKPSLDSMFSGHESDIAQMAQYFIDYPVDEAEFGEVGRRVSFLSQWMTMAEQNSSTKLNDVIPETMALSMFPFLRNPTHPQDPRPLASLRQSFTPGTRGIVLTTGVSSFRFACHLIRNLRDVLHSNLPIQIVHAGEKDLPARYRNAMTSLGENITTLDILQLFDDTTLDLLNGKYAMKPFALLAATFEEVILVDADAIFLQRPEVIFDHHEGYKQTGTLFFRDRLMWQDDVEHRHKWWDYLLRAHKPSETLQKSVVLNSHHDKLLGAHEQDSGVVVLNKSKIPILTGLLHICWQNSKSVRNKYTYYNTFGDKETYWMGMELCNVPYTFADYYGGVVGSCIGDGVCGSTIAHMDESKKLLWWNGSLLKNKNGFQTEFMTPDCWMLGGTWAWNSTYEHGACMSGGRKSHLENDESAIVMLSVDAAKVFDEILDDSLDLSHTSEWGKGPHQDVNGMEL